MKARQISYHPVYFDLFSTQKYLGRNFEATDDVLIT